MQDLSCSENSGLILFGLQTTTVPRIWQFEQSYFTALASWQYDGKLTEQVCCWAWSLSSPPLERISDSECFVSIKKAKVFHTFRALLLSDSYQFQADFYTCADRLHCHKFFTTATIPFFSRPKCGRSVWACLRCAAMFFRPCVTIDYERYLHVAGTKFDHLKCFKWTTSCPLLKKNQFATNCSFFSVGTWLLNMQNCERFQVRETGGSDCARRQVFGEDKG